MESNNDYFSYAEQSVSSGEYQQKFDSQCSNLVDRQLDEAKQLLSNYSESLNHDLNKYFDYLEPISIGAKFITLPSHIDV